MRLLSSIVRTHFLEISIETFFRKLAAVILQQYGHGDTVNWQTVRVGMVLSRIEESYSHKYYDVDNVYYNCRIIKIDSVKAFFHFDYVIDKYDPGIIMDTNDEATCYHRNSMYVE